MHISNRTVLAVALAGLLAGIATLAQAQQETGRVISSTPIRDSTGQTSYSVVYDHGGRQYTTRMDSPPGPTIALQQGSYGVTTSPVPDPSPIVNNSGSGAPWANIAPEPGVVVGAGAPPPAPAYGPTPAYGAPPVYAAPAYPPPAYVAPAYGYAAPYYVGPPIGFSLNLGYSRGWRR